MAEKNTTQGKTLGALIPVDANVPMVVNPEDIANKPVAIEACEPDIGYGEREIIRAYYRDFQSGQLYAITWPQKSVCYQQLDELMTQQLPLPIPTRIQRFGKYWKHG